MINIRRNVFETNSSSSHSISICQDSNGVLDTIACDPDGTITIRGGWFGREWEAYNDPMVKASYCLSDCKGFESQQNMLREVIQEHTGCKEVIFVVDDDSYVGHNTTGCTNVAFDDKENLKSLLFNPRSFIFSGSDESSPPPNFYDAGKDITYRYQLEVDGTDLVYKFEDTPDRTVLELALNCIMDRHKSNRYADCCDPNSDSNLSYVPYYRQGINGNKISSFTKLSQGIVILYNLESKYVDKGNKYIGEKVVKTLELYFRIVPI